MADTGGSLAPRPRQPGSKAPTPLRSEWPIRFGRVQAVMGLCGRCRLVFQVATVAQTHRAAGGHELPIRCPQCGALPPIVRVPKTVEDMMAVAQSFIRAMAESLPAGSAAQHMTRMLPPGGDPWLDD